jgi:hypothetical protein
MTTKHILKPIKFLFLLLIIAITLIAFNGVVCSAEAGGFKGDIELSSELIISESGKEVVNFGELKNYFDIPEGYKVAAIGEFKTNVFTMKCSYKYILSSALSVCESKKYHGFGLVDIKRPDIINDCYRAKIIFFVAIQ